jgi:sorbitol-specific phosphotransferase system component IIBC
MVHDFGGLVVFEALFFHHMAPMASAVANAHPYQFVLSLGLLPSFLAPGLPINGVIGVLLKVKTRFLQQSIGASI